LQLIGFSPSPVDDLVRRCQFSAAAVMAAISDLEFASLVEMLPGNQVSLVPDPSFLGESDLMQRTP